MHLSNDFLPLTAVYEFSYVMKLQFLFLVHALFPLQIVRLQFFFNIYYNISWHIRSVSCKLLHSSRAALYDIFGVHIA